MPFKPGESGNPGGRQQENQAVRRAAREKSLEALEKLVEWMQSDNPKASVSACNAILDRAYGKPAQAIIGGEGDDPPVVVRIERVIVRSDPKP